MNKIKLLILFILLVFVSSSFSCEKLGLCKDAELHFEREDFTRSSLKTRGFYYGDISNSGFAKTFILYLNGVSYGGESSVRLSQIGNPFSNGDWAETKKNSKPEWGVFKVKGNDIEISFWNSQLSGCNGVSIERGKILSDTSFLLEPRGTIRAEESIFYFHPLSVKPDSSNIFIN